MLRVLSYLFGVSVLAVLAAGVLALYLMQEFSRDLPDHEQLASYEPPTVTRVHAGDGRLLAEYATEKRVFVPIEAIPRRLINAFLAAEDKNFYSHRGVDALSIVRAVLVNLQNLGQNRRPVGASTITQQVAKNFLLTNEVSIERKIREAIIALRIEQAFSKDHILELYLNEIFLGFRSYGVAAAALNYFNKSLDELTIAEAAFLAALPKAPNNYHPIRHPEAARIRRDWVIGRMLEDGRITQEEADEAWAQPLEIRRRDATEVVEADHFAEEVRRELARLYGEDGLYKGGLSVRTTIDPRLQAAADRTLREGLIAYDRRHGWRGPLTNLDLATLEQTGEDWRDKLAEIPRGAALPEWQLAVVLELSNAAASIGLADDEAVGDEAALADATGEVPAADDAIEKDLQVSDRTIPMAELRWARPTLEDQKVGARPERPSQVLKVGDVILVEPVSESGDGKAYPENTYALRQIPAVNGGIVALDPHTGRILAMTGGFSYADSEFNRVTQALRQPGSAFKPIVYLAGLDSGFTPATMILDAPFVIDQGAGLGKWKPANYTRKFYGPTPMRIGIEKSRNLMTVRLAQTIGMERVVETAQRLGVIDDMPALLSMSLGAAETTLLRMTTAYAMLVNGGKRIEPTVIDRVQDRHGQTIYRHVLRDCPSCRTEVWQGQPVPTLPDNREQVADPRSAYQVVSMLQGVVQRGTGRKIAEIGKPLAGKTGTTNDAFDTWFVGFSPDLAVGVYIGFDEPRTLGPKETGSSVSAPVFKAFMEEALENEPATPFRIPPGIRLVRVNATTGQLAQAGDSKVILEAFLPGTIPDGQQIIIDGGYGGGEPGAEGTDGTGLAAQPRSSGGSTIDSGLY